MDRLAQQEVGHCRLGPGGENAGCVGTGTGGVAHRETAAHRRTCPAFCQDRVERRRPALQQRVLRGVLVGIGRGIARPHLVADHVGQRQQALEALAVVVVGGRRQQAVAELVEQSGAGPVEKQIDALAAALLAERAQQLVARLEVGAHLRALPAGRGDPALQFGNVLVRPLHVGEVATILLGECRPARHVLFIGLALDIAAGERAPHLAARIDVAVARQRRRGRRLARGPYEAAALRRIDIAALVARAIDGIERRHPILLAVLPAQLFVLALPRLERVLRNLPAQEIADCL